MLLFKMADKLRPDELQAFKGAFDMFDRNGDGTISTKVSNTSNMAFPVVEFSRQGYKLERFLAKNQHYSNEMTKF